MGLSPGVRLRRELGICIMSGCGQPVVDKHWRCVRCRANEAEDQAFRRECKDAGKKKIDRRRKEHRRAA